MEGSNSELDSFREQWRAEVSAKSKAQQPSRVVTSKVSDVSRTSSPRDHASRTLPKKPLEEVEDINQVSFEPQFNGTNIVNDISPDNKHLEPQTALEHYERTVERETEGSLGDSLTLYRKAYRLDSCVDQLYKKKHFPATTPISKPSDPNPSGVPATIPNPAHHTLDGSPPNFHHLIESFSGLRIEPAASAIEGTLPPSCPLSALPHEIIVQILIETALLDVVTYVTLARVCKRLAYLVISEDQVWRRICLESEVGFGTMHYQWNFAMFGEALDTDIGLSTPATVKLLPQNAKDRTSKLLPTESRPSRAYVTDLLLHNIYENSYLTMFRERPRIRFNGCYISTVNYMRPGQASVSQVSWNSPVHIVTYYRYLRFFRDGSVISLLTTSEPLDVVYHLTKNNVALHRDGMAPHLPSSVMSNALPGRWRLSSIDDRIQAGELSNGDLAQAEKYLIIETEGVGPKSRYKYQMTLGLRSTGKGGPRNNKLVWKEYWNYNRLTDDWAQFGLKNDKAFLWSRVKSYGSGV